jgi:hypothetical protein
MQPTDANSNFRPNEIAARALATGFLNQSPSAIDAGDMTFSADYQSRLSAIALPPPVMSNGTAGEYGEHSLRSCPPSISTPTSSCADMNYWVPMATQPAKGSNNNNNKQVYLPSSTRKVESAERLRQHVNTALYQQHQQLQYGSPHRPTAHYWESVCGEYGIREIEGIEQGGFAGKRLFTKSKIRGMRGATVGDHDDPILFLYNK